MSNKKFYFEDVTLLVTHYNRSKSLGNLLMSFKEQECEFGDIVISDDASHQDHLNEILQLKSNFSFRLITTGKNGGLGSNLNKGQAAVNTPYTLYVQEDFEAMPEFGKRLHEALELMKEKGNIDIVRFYAYWKFPYLRPFKKGYSEMIFKPWLPGYKKFYYYSDHPHLRKSSFNKKFGLYTEGVNAERAEYRMMISFLQKGGKGLYYDKYNSLFRHANSNDEPSTMKRNNLRRSNNFFISFVRDIYRHIKFNADLLFLR